MDSVVVVDAVVTVVVAAAAVDSAAAVTVVVAAAAVVEIAVETVGKILKRFIKQKALERGPSYLLRCQDD